MFSAFLLLFSLVCLGTAVLLLSACRNEALLPRWENIPRMRVPGIVLTAAAIFWCVPNIRPILDPGSFLQNLLIPLAVVAVILCAVFLDYLVSRASAALLILTAHYFLKETFAADVYPASAFFSAGVLLFGCAGIVSGIKPWWMRDWIRALFRRPWVRFVSAGLLIFIAATGLWVFFSVRAQAQGAM